MSAQAHVPELARALVAAGWAVPIRNRLAKLSLPPMDDPTDAAAALVRASGAKSQGDVAVLTINLTAGQLTGEQLTGILRAGFPPPGAKIGDRHGPHYLSLARTGKLDGIETKSIAHTARKSKITAVVIPPTSVAVTEPVTTQEPTEVLADETPTGAAALELGGVTDGEAKLPGFEPAETAPEVVEALVTQVEAAVVEQAVLEADVPPLVKELRALNQKDLAARAKAVGVKSTGKSVDVIARILAAT